MDKTEIITTQYGKIQGYKNNNVQIFKGIPYAGQPIGNLRFNPPPECESWEGVRDATEYGPYAIQGFTELEKLFGKPSWESEADCLNLNIWTPSADNNKRPVMVWFHGGAYIFGGGANPIYDGSALANIGNIVVVTINYRLGAFGFLYSSGITANVGMLDQVAALKWIRDNIEAFGGDPNSVTIFGESAGGISVLTLITMPAAKGLFHRVISQSAPILDPTPTIRSTENLFHELGIRVGDIDSLRKISANKLIDAQNKSIAKAEKRGDSELMHFRPSIDGNILPIHPLEALKKGVGKSIDLIIGHNLEEAKLFTVFDPRMSKLNQQGLEKIVIAGLNKIGVDKNKCLELIETYRKLRKERAFPVEPIDLLNAILTDFLFRIPEIRWAEEHHKSNKNTYMYTFTWPSPAFGGKLGVCHVAELPFVFGTLHLPKVDLFFGKGSEANTLSQRMIKWWTQFAHSGNPNNNNPPTWLTYDTKNRTTMFMGKEFKIVNAPFDKERTAWDRLI